MGRKYLIEEIDEPSGGGGPGCGTLIVLAFIAFIRLRMAAATRLSPQKISAPCWLRSTRLVRIS